MPISNSVLVAPSRRLLTSGRLLSLQSLRRIWYQSIGCQAPQNHSQGIGNQMLMASLVISLGQYTEYERKDHCYLLV
jgi:hypothetical protein